VTTFENIAEALAARVEPAGFELLGAVNVGAYNATLEPKHAGLRLPELSGARDVVLLIGNTRRLWPLFLDAYATTSIGTDEEPLDDYSRWHLGDAATAVATELERRHAIRYSFEPEPRGVAIHRLAVLSGVAELSPVGLCVHPVNGPWFSMRAAIVFDVEGPPPRTAPPTCSACTTRPCLAAREKMLETCGGRFDRATFLAHWEAWLAMRDACPIGKDARYGDEQIRYHYLKDRSVLDAASRDIEARSRRG
jgi:methylmalonic aciduria homocystinuria type C protein